jgi:hypothetical protein
MYESFKSITCFLPQARTQLVAALTYRVSYQPRITITNKVQV